MSEILQQMQKGWARPLESARRWLATGVKPFTNDQELMQGVRLVFALGSMAEDCAEEASLETIEKMLGAMRRRIHRRMDLPESDSHLVKICRTAELESFDRELFLAMVVSAFGIIDRPGWARDVDDLQALMKPVGFDPLEVVQHLSPGSPLVSAGLLRVGDGDDPRDMSLQLAPWVMEQVWLGEKVSIWRFQTQEEACDRLIDFSRACARHLDKLNRETFSHRSEEVARDKSSLPAMRLQRAFMGGLAEHPDWPLTRVTKNLDAEDRAILFLLIGKEYGHLEPTADLYTGRGLAASCAVSFTEFRRTLRRLSRDGSLRSRGWIRVCGGMPPGNNAEDESILRTAEFELSATLRRRLSIPRQWRSRGGQLREANSSLGNLVLHPETREALNMALAQARRAGSFLEKWGLRDLLPYGGGVTLLFSGPPGVGKTASAEGLAKTLGKPILIVDHADVQSCWVGETEKNLRRCFRDAADEDAVLFWDEADALFYDRELAQRSWEISAVNVLLKEIEAFEGVCILATNRPAALDPALTRRVNLRVDFPQPTREMSAQIWRTLLPEKFPHREQVDFESLGRLGLNGGQIKNAVLNAARSLQLHGERAGVGTEVLRQAAERELRALCERPSIGFKEAS